MKRNIISVEKIPLGVFEVNITAAKIKGNSIETVAEPRLCNA